MTRDDTKYIKYTDPQTLNLYEYCDDDPVLKTDPNGNDPPEWAQQQEMSKEALSWVTGVFGGIEEEAGEDLIIGLEKAYDRYVWKGTKEGTLDVTQDAASINETKNQTAAFKDSAEATDLRDAILAAVKAYVTKR